MNMFSKFFKILFKSKCFKMQNKYYYKIKMPFPQYYSMSVENLSSGFPAISDINQGV